MSVIEGRLVRGLGEGASFTQIDWVRRQLIEIAGIDPYPGTVNLVLEDDASLAAWGDWRELPGATIEPGDPAFCRARCYPARIAGRVPAAVILPELAQYPKEKFELVAALPVREHLSLAEGDRVAVQLCRPIAARAVLFDIDGTMVDSLRAFLEVARAAAEPHGLEVTERQVRQSLVTGSGFWSGVVPRDHADPDAITKALAAHAAREWPRILREHARVFEGLAQTLDTLKELGMLLGIVSGARGEVLELLREQGLLDRFAAVVLASDVTRRKPDPQGILLCLQRLGVAPQAAIYVGDTPLDIQASRAAGVHSVGVLTGAGDSALLSSHWPDRLLASHAGLSGIIEPA